VGCFPPNGFELHDMVGNVWEWTRSVSGFAYPYDQDDPAREDPTEGGHRVVRGGAWGGIQVDARCAYRFGLLPDDRDYDLGFRVVLRSPLLP